MRSLIVTEYTEDDVTSALAEANKRQSQEVSQSTRASFGLPPGGELDELDRVLLGFTNPPPAPVGKDSAPAPSKTANE